MAAVLDGNHASHQTRLLHHKPLIYANPVP